jgi:hypothetical protein
MDNTITVNIVNKYGNDKIYPVCPLSQGFCKLLVQKTLTERDIGIIKSMGFAVAVEPTQPKTL